ncbi:MAG: pilus assembly protein PilP [Persicimonas sp.]
MARSLAVVLVACCVALSGCADFLGLDSSEGTSNASQDDEADKSAPKVAEDDEAEEEVEEEYERPEYPNSVRRNPFLPDLEVIRPKKQLAEGSARPLEPLEQYGIGQLALVAIISEVAVPKAMFLDPEGFGHVVKEGDRVGENGGTITDIRDNEVEVREITDEEDSETRLTTVELRTEELDEEDDDELSDEEREALKRLLESDEGRKTLEGLSSEASSEGGSRRTRQDERFKGLSPPER